MTDWVFLHGGALGDLALTLQLALRMPGVNRESAVLVISRTDTGDLSGCQPSVKFAAVLGSSGEITSRSCSRQGAAYSRVGVFRDAAAA
jgi:hypothetical protein